MFTAYFKVGQPLPAPSYVNEHNFKIPHSAHNGLTPAEVYNDKRTLRFFNNLKKKTKESMQIRQEVYYEVAS